MTIPGNILPEFVISVTKVFAVKKLGARLTFAVVVAFEMDNTFDPELIL